MAAEDPVHSGVSNNATALAVRLTQQYGDMALGRARMMLYAALRNRDPAQVTYIAQACFIIMKQERFLQTAEMDTAMQETDRESHLHELAASLDHLIAFAEVEDDFVLAAKLDDIRVRFAERYAFDSK